MTGRPALPRRIAALVTNRLAVELAQRARPGNKAPLAVIIHADELTHEPNGNARLDAVDERAWQYGVRPGQTTAEAAAYLSSLQIIELPRCAIDQALSSVAELALGFAPLVSLELELQSPEPFVRYPAGAGAGPRDTVWLDVTGCSRLLGPEEVLCQELRERLGQLGHHARVAVADGPRLAQALARWGGVESVAPPGHSAAALAELPIASLPLDASVIAWLGEVGLWTVGELATVERRRLAQRLGKHAKDVLELVAGRDDVPLRAYEPERRIVEHVAFDEPLENHQPLLFIVRGMVSRATARLAARGEACGKASLELIHDRSAIAIAARGARVLEPFVLIDLGLPIALAREDDLLRAIQTRVEKLELKAPIGGVSLVLEELTRRSESQLDLSNLSAANPDALVTLLAELCAAVGPARVGVLEVRDSHRPEARSACVPVPLTRRNSSTSTPSKKRRQAPTQALSDAERQPTEEPLLLFVPTEPSRILPEPVCIGSLRPGALIAADRVMYLVDHLRLSARLEGVEWWGRSPISRDYARVQLHASHTLSGTRVAAGLLTERTEHAEAWVFIDRVTGRAFLHGWFE